MLRSWDAIRSLFEERVADFSSGSSVDVQQQIVEGEMASLVWLGESETFDLPSPPTL